MWRNDIKGKYMFMFTLKNFARKWFRYLQVLTGNFPKCSLAVYWPEGVCTRNQLSQHCVQQSRRRMRSRAQISRMSLHWRHNYHDSDSNHQPHGCLLNRLFGRRSKKTSKLRVTGLCAGNSPGPMNSPYKGPVTRKMFPYDDVIMVEE